MLPAGGQSLVRVALIGALVVSVLGSAVASPQTPVFRATTQYVAMDVIVRDRDGHPVTDLTKDDFLVSERDRPQKITDFAYISIPVADRAVNLDVPPPPPSDVATNGRTSQDSRALVLAVDNTTLLPQDLVPVKRALAEFFRKLSPDDQVALTYIGRSDLSHDFTNDVGELIASIKLRETLGQPSYGGMTATIRSLEYIVRTLAEARQGRRAVILLSSRTCNPAPPPPPPRNDFSGASVRASMDSDQCRDLIERARRADVAFYTLDPRLFTDINSVNGIGQISTPEDAAALSQAALDDDSTMKTLASSTGGRAFTRVSNPLRAVQDIMVDNGSYYLLGFYPDPVVNDGKFHDVKVTVKRPGVSIRARAGYMAGDARSPRPSTATRDMTATLGGGIDDPSLPIRAVVAPIASGPNGTRALVTIEVAYPPPQDESLALDDELRVGVLSLTSDAKIKASFQRPIALTGRWKPAARGIFVIGDAIDLPPKTLSLRIGVSSRALAKSGTAHITVTVPDFGRNDLQLSSLVIGSSESTFDAALGLDHIRPLVPFLPTTSRSFAHTDRVRVFANAFWKSDDEAVVADVSVTGAPAFPTQHFTLPGRLGRDGHRSATLDVALPLNGLTPGQYVLRVNAHSPKREPFAREVPFEVR
jgi:VWFA-related protein